LVKGEPIVAYCDRNNLSIEDRLELFAQVCNAVQHAHTKGIIHRDLKPSNILVSTQDGRPHTKVIDFGIAKATASKLTEKTLFTEHKALIGTPEYMSPEQAEGNLDIDTRTDVYSLGVLLYELLTGTTPFEGTQLRSAAYAEIQRIIREVEPPKPSTRLSANNDTLASVAAKRHTEPKRLGILVRGELDWIVMKALEKDRQRRYETANGLALDIQRYLTGDAVVAAPPSRLYRLRKFVRRNKGPVAAAATTSAALVLGAAGFAWQAYRIGIERDHAIAAEESAVAERNRATAIKGYLIKTLQSVDPTHEGRQDTLLSEAVLAGAARLNSGELDDQPRIRAELLSALALILDNTGKGEDALPIAEQAVSILRKALQGDHLELARALNALGRVLYSVGRAAAAEQAHAEALAMARRICAGDHPDVAESIASLAFVVESLGRPLESEPLQVEALEMFRRLNKGDHADIAGSLTGLASVREAMGQTAEARISYVDALEMYQRLYTRDNPAVATAMIYVGRTNLELGDAAQAESRFTQALEMNRRLFKQDHPTIAMNLYNLAAACTDLGESGRAIAAADEAVAMERRLYSTAHPALARALFRAGNARLAAGNAQEALPLLQECVAVSDVGFSPEHRFFQQHRDALARCRAMLAEVGKTDAKAGGG
ncbi:MAG: tetratricopeptide repeat protein, partial [Phycisphaerales bacterium]